LSLSCLPSLSAQPNSSSFIVSPPSFSSGAGQAPAIYNFAYRIDGNRVLLSWEAGNNENNERFELERSRDGEKFEMAALLFGTDKPGTDNYLFYEKLKTGRIFYRVKIIHKDQQTEYSAVLLAKK
jgi:hypothetical protein